MMIKDLEDPFYYLENFHRVLDWIRERYSDLLHPDELAFIDGFPALPKAARALLVRMVMRKGTLFRSSKLDYAEIGAPAEAAAALAAAGWIDADPLLTLEQLFGLLKKSELAQAFELPPKRAALKKDELLASLCADFAAARRYREWHAACEDVVYQVMIDALCERLRLMFFGNLRQDWTEFVLADLGVFRYEKVALSAASRGFRHRRDIDDYLHLHACRERFAREEPLTDILAAIPTAAYDNEWLESRRSKLLFRIAQHLEQSKEYEEALRIYQACGFPGARIRCIRILERLGRFAAAFALAESAGLAPESEAEQQQLLRILPRLGRQLGHPKAPKRPPAPVNRHDLVLPRPDGQTFYVEGLVRDFLMQADAPVHYVENTLINSLFGLLCWRAIFAPVPGAFFHPFHSGPADLHSADFHRRRSAEFRECLSELENGCYRATILQNFRDKAGIQSPFVAWGILSEELLELALTCLPPAHLKKWFERILLDVRQNRTGLPDLIQFWPQEKRYRMVEVKGPGDRLQDNQIRWLDYCAAHAMPVEVCYVQWQEQEQEQEQEHAPQPE